MHVHQVLREITAKKVCTSDNTALFKQSTVFTGIYRAVLDGGSFESCSLRFAASGNAPAETHDCTTTEGDIYTRNANLRDLQFDWVAEWGDPPYISELIRDYMVREKTRIGLVESEVKFRLRDGQLFYLYTYMCHDGAFVL